MPLAVETGYHMEYFLPRTVTCCPSTAVPASSLVSLESIATTLELVLGSERRFTLAALTVAL